MATPQVLPSNPTQTPPGPTPSLLQILLPNPKRNRLQSMLTNWRKYGDIVYAKIGPIHNYTLFKPEYVYHVLVTNQKNYIKGIGYNSLSLMLGKGLVNSDGDLWKRQRRLMSPHFTPTAVLDFSEMMTKTTQHMLAQWEQSAKENKPIHVDIEMMRLTMSIIGQALFSFDLGNTPTEIGLALQEAFSFIPTRSFLSLVPMWFPLAAHRRFKHNLKIIDKFIYDQIAEGRLHPERKNFLSVMLKVVDSETGQGMSDQQLRDEVITLFFAGFETTARTLTWGWYLLGQHPDVVEKLRAEADAILNQPGHIPEKADLERLTYSRMVVDETLRIYPPTAAVSRQNIEADEIAGYKIPPKSLLTLSPYIVHRYPEYWPDPERFDPQRFSAENAAGRPKWAFIPFAAGPRVCIGNSFALMEMVYAFAMAAQRFTFKTVTEGEIVPTVVGTIRPLQPLTMQVSLRK